MEQQQTAIYAANQTANGRVT